MVSRARIQKKRLRREIARPMGIRGKGPLEAESNQKIQAMFHPHSKKGPKKDYPLYQIFHEFAKMPRETITNFVNLGKLTSTLRQNKAIGNLLKKNPKLEASFRTSVMNAIRERGIKGSKYWVTAPKGYIDKIVAGGKKNPSVMNVKTGEIIAGHFGKEVKPRTIIDIGSFAGGTITSIVGKLGPAQRKVLNVVLVDVAGKIVKKHAVPALVNLGVPRKNIKVVPSSFYNAAVAFRQMPRPLHEKGERRYAKDFIRLIGKADAVVAGAASINFANDLRPYLKSVKKLLKKGGIFINWDWGSAEVRSPSIDVAKSKKTVIGKAGDGRPVTEYDANASFFNFWLGFFNYPEQVKRKMFADMNKAKKFNFMKWCERNVKFMEEERKRTGGAILADPAGFRNRAYRMGHAMQEEARRQGLSPSEVMHPIAKPGERDTGNVNWMLAVKKH